METEVITQLNWVDIFIVIIFFRIGYVALESGLPLEIFKFLGTVSAVYLSSHYYVAISDYIRQRLATDKLPLEFLDFIIFVVLAIIGYATFILLRTIFCRFVKMETAQNIAKWGGLIIGIGRSFLLAGLICFMLAISSIPYLKTSVEHSYLGKRVLKITPNTYTWLWNAVFSKFAMGEKFNETVNEVQSPPAQK